MALIANKQHTSKDSTITSSNEAAIANLDSLKQLYQTNPSLFAQTYLNKPIGLIGTVSDKGEFELLPTKQTDNWGREQTMYGVHTNLTEQDFNAAGIHKSQHTPAFYDEDSKRFIDEKIDGKKTALDYLETLYLNIKNRDGEKGCDFDPTNNNEAMSADEQTAMWNDVTRQNLNELKQQFPNVAASLQNGKIHLLADAKQQDLFDSQLIDKVTITGTLVEVQPNQANGIALAIKYAKIINKQTVFDLNSLPVFKVNILSNTQRVDSATALAE